mgnify:CR=1 FL=1
MASSDQPKADFRDALIAARYFFDRHDFQSAARKCREILNRDGTNIEAMSLLGSIAEKTGANDAAISVFSRALEVDGANLGAHLGLGSALAASGSWDKAAASYRRAVEPDGNSVDALNGLGTALIALGDRPAALRAFEQVLRINRANDMATFMANALKGNAQPPKAHIISASFDRYAGTFEKHLVDVLHYQMPRLIAETLAEYHPAPFAAGVDLGCGTGLLVDSMPPDRIKAIDGVDLAPKMIEEAGKKRRYRNLAVGDIADYLNARPVASYDLIVSADVFIYVGPLERIFAGVDRVLAADGLCCFSVEHTEAEGYEVQASSRYAHSVGYIDHLAAQFNLERVHSAMSPLRRENGADIPGRLDLLRRAQA